MKRACTTIADVGYDDERVVGLMVQFNDEVVARTTARGRPVGCGIGQATGTSADATADDFRDAGAFVGAFDDGRLIACGGVRMHGAEAEIKRMFVTADARGGGLARRLLAELERRAEALGATVIRLDTSDVLFEAIALYRSVGFVEVGQYNDRSPTCGSRRSLRLCSGPVIATCFAPRCSRDRRTP